LCEYCSFRVYCPAFGGDIEEGVRVAASIRSAATLEHVVSAPPHAALAD
jgi:hypothetical protein